VPVWAATTTLHTPSYTVRADADPLAPATTASVTSKVAATFKDLMMDLCSVAFID
jgi:hypothetical protein